MSIIERVGSLLGSVPQTNRRKSAGVEELSDGNLESNVIERAIRGKGARTDVIEESLTTKLDATVRTATASVHRHTTAVKIDFSRLRAQNLIVPGDARTRVAEDFRRIKRPILANVTNAEAGDATNLVMVTSPSENMGKTFCAINLALSITMELDRTVLLVDADVAKPSVWSVLGVEPKRGLMDVLRDRNTDVASALCNTNIPKLTLLMAGKEHHYATELLASEAMGVLLREMAGRYHDRIIIFDSPPLLGASESSVLANRMGQIVIVVEAGKVTNSQLKDALGRLESSSRVGMVLNKEERFGSGYYGGGNRA